ncbi:MAG TPA: alcohol dehydrogenase, partial [Burkholderia sp.]|nr:alcohol dehydrogenase [Burkholderia sp.]
MEMSPNSMRFETVPSILQEWGCVRRLGQVMAEWTDRRNVLIVTDAGLHKAGVLEPAKASLAA